MNSLTLLQSLALGQICQKLDAHYLEAVIVAGGDHKSAVRRHVVAPHGGTAYPEPSIRKSDAHCLQAVIVTAGDHKSAVRRRVAAPHGGTAYPKP